MEFIDNDISKILNLYNNVKNKKNLDKNKTKEYFNKILQMINILKLKKSNDILLTTEQEIKKILNNYKNDDIFELINMGEIEKIKSLENINFRELNNDGNTLLHHAVKIGDTHIIKILLKKGGSIDQVNGNGHTLLEYACLCKDPNIINFLLIYGANMNKHLFFREGNHKLYLNKSDIDLAILLKIIIINSKNKEDYGEFKFLEKYFNLEELVGLENFKIKDIMIGLTEMFKGKKQYEDYKKIIIEELENYINIVNKKCSYQKIDIVLINLVPFINYPFNISSSFIIKNELKYLILNLINENKNSYKKILVDYIFDKYIKTSLFTQDYLGIILYQILSKNKL
jgi:hypothetical protein